MLFHSPFNFFRENRRVFVDKPGAMPEVTDTQKQKAAEVINALQETLKADPDAAGAIAEFKVEEADKDAKKFQEAYHTALKNAANAYYKSLAAEDDDQAKVEKINDLFKAAKAPVAFQLAGSELVIAPEAPEEKGEKGRVLSATEKQFIAEAFPKPKEAASAERVLKAMQKGSPQLKVAETVYKTFIDLPLAEKQAVLNNPQSRQKFLNALTPEGRQFMAQLSQDLEASSKELSEDELEEIEENARNFLKKKKFDVSKASEMEKNLMLAQLQMRGIDTSGGEEILKDPSKLKAFKGSPMERGFNQIMGLITLVLLYIQKMKDMFKPKEKKSPEAPAEDKNKKGSEALSPEKEAMRQKLKEQMKSKTGAVLLSERETKRTGIQNQIKTTNNLKGKTDDESKVAYEARKGELPQLTQEEAQLSQEIAMLQEMKKETETQKSTLTAGKDALVSYLKQPNAKAKIPNGDQIRENLEKVSFTLNDRYELCIRNITGDAVDPAVLNVLSGNVRIRSGITGIDHFAIDDQGVLKQPENLQTLFRQLLEGFRAEVKTDEPPHPAAAPAVASAPAGASPAAPASPKS